MTPKLMVVMSDTHFGSAYAPMPDELTDGLGGTRRPNLVQRWLNARFADTIEHIKQVAADDAFILLINGDIIEGYHHGGKDLVASSPLSQLGIAKEMLAPLVKAAASVVIVEGTECHTEQTENYLGKELNAFINPETGGHVFRKFYARINGTVVSAKHHMPTTSREWLKANALGISMANEQLAEARSGWPMSQIMIRAHRHIHGVYSDGDAKILCCGSWQGDTRYTAKVVPDAICEPSVCIIDWRKCGQGLPTIHEYKHKLPSNLIEVGAYAGGDRPVDQTKADGVPGKRRKRRQLA